MSVSLTCRNIEKTFRQRKDFLSREYTSVPAVRDISVRCESRGIYGVVGESGCGKSTLARIITGIIRPDYGEVFLNNVLFHSAAKPRVVWRPDTIQMVFQNPFQSLDPRWKIERCVREGLQALSVSRKEQYRRIHEMLEAMGFSQSVLRVYPHELSGGERQRIAIARALVVAPQVLVLDEPVSSLDVSIQAKVLALLHEVIRGKDMITIFISHDIALMQRLVDYVFVMHDGIIIESEKTADVFTNPQQPYTQELVHASLW